MITAGLATEHLYPAVCMFNNVNPTGGWARLTNRPTRCSEPQRRCRRSFAEMDPGCVMLPTASALCSTSCAAGLGSKRQVGQTEKPENACGDRSQPNQSPSLSPSSRTIVPKSMSPAALVRRSTRLGTQLRSTVLHQGAAHAGVPCAQLGLGSADCERYVWPLGPWQHCL